MWLPVAVMRNPVDTSSGDAAAGGVGHSWSSSEIQTTWGMVGVGPRLYYIGQSTGIARMCQMIFRSRGIKFTGEQGT
jgi:hypothetical protein